MSASSIRLNWTAGPASVASYSIARSTDGQNFNTVATGVSGSASTWTDPAVLSAGTSYAYRIVAVNAAGTSPASNVASATTLQAGNLTYMSDLTPTSATSGWGTVQMDKAVSGKVLTLRGQTYAKGIGTHVLSSIAYNLNGQYGTFLSDIGVDDGTKGVGSIIFQVVGDGVVLYDSGVLTSNSAVASININVTGVQNLTLWAKSGVPGSIDYGHADWAGLDCSRRASRPRSPLPPTSRRPARPRTRPVRAVNCSRPSDQHLRPGRRGAPDRAATCVRSHLPFPFT
jgi:hypothetical protein